MAQLVRQRTLLRIFSNKAAGAYARHIAYVLCCVACILVLNQRNVHTHSCMQGVSNMLV